MDLLTWTFSKPPAEPERPLLIDALDPSRSLSFVGLRASVRQLAKGLRNAGVEPGDCVCVLAFNDICYSVLYFGIIGAGARFLGLNPSFTSHELSHYFQLTKPKLVIVEPQLLERAREAAEETGLPRSSIFIFDVHDQQFFDDHQSWTTLLQHGEMDWVRPDDPSTTTCHYALTSGTSGLPKAAMLSHSYHVSQARIRVSDPGLPYEVTRLSPLPPFHVFATPIVPSSIHQGYPTYIMRRFDMQSFIEAIERFSVTETFVAPSIVTAMPQSPYCSRTALASLRQIWFGGASIKYANRLPLYSFLNASAQINPVWGMTEAGWVAATQWPDTSGDDSTGRALEGVQLKVVDDDDQVILEKGVPGEILAKPPFPMLRYLGNPEATQAAFSEDGWVRTGDVGCVRDGKVFLLDRKKDLIKVRGWQVSPTEIESELLQHPEIIDAAVVGIKAEDGVDEWPRAYVVRKPGSPLTERKVRDYLKESLAGYKLPKEIQFRDSIPKNPTGKILRRNLIAEGGEAASQPGGSWKASITDLKLASQLWRLCKRATGWCWMRLRCWNRLKTA